MNLGAMLIIEKFELRIFTISCQNLQPTQITDFKWISENKTPPPLSETGSYDPSISSPF
jgi:hypothetical protein